MIDVDASWDEQKEDVFSVVAIIDAPPSVQIEYAFKAGYLEAAKEAERLRAALAWYADEENWTTEDHWSSVVHAWPIGGDYGQRARDALRAEESP